MDQLQLAKNILHHRQQAEITQEHLAHVLGVTKAAVSKWETGQSLPDILILPKLATYFNLTIDELMGFSRQLSAEQIQRLYKTLAETFAAGSIEQAIASCQRYIKDYYHCYPLLVKICGLYINHLELITDAEQKAKLTNDIIFLCKHIKKHSDDINVLQETKIVLTITYLFSQQPQLALEQIGEHEPLIVPSASLRAQCYAMLGEPGKAQYMLQIGIYQYLLVLVQTLTDYIPLQFQNETMFEETYRRVLSVNETFNLPYLHPNSTVRTHYIAAMGYVQFGKNDIAMKCLKRYISEIKSYLFPPQLKGDSFFTHIPDWFEDMNISIEAPRDSSIVKQALIQSLQHPAFQQLQVLPDFKQFEYELQQLSIN